VSSSKGSVLFVAVFTTSVRFELARTGILCLTIYIGHEMLLMVYNRRDLTCLFYRSLCA
jgi:hypothetical protein